MLGDDEGVVAVTSVEVVGDVVGDVEGDTTRQVRIQLLLEAEPIAGGDQPSSGY